MLTVRVRNLRPQSLRARTAAIPHVEGNHPTGLAIHDDPDPLFVRFLLCKAGHCIPFHLKASHHDVAVTGDRLDVEVIRQGLKAGDESTQEPLEVNARGATKYLAGRAIPVTSPQ